MLRNITLLFISIALSTPAVASIDLDKPIVCTYQRGQFLTKNESSNVGASEPRKWSFYKVGSKKPILVTNDKTENLHPIPIKNGVAVYLFKPKGITIFAIWNSGESLLSRQENVAETVYGQQFIGRCVN